MTTLNPDLPALVSPRRPRERRVHLAMTAALAAAVLAVGGASTAVLVSDAGTSPPRTAAPPAPAAPPPAPLAAPTGPVPVAPPAPVAAATGAPVVTDAAGAALPAAVTDGVRALDAALSTGDIAALRAAYAPVAGSAPWSAVEQVMTDPRVRGGLQAALRTPPAPRGDVPHVYAGEGYRLGIDAAGKIRFVRAP